MTRPGSCCYDVEAGYAQEEAAEAQTKPREKLPRQQSLHSLTSVFLITILIIMLAGIGILGSLVVMVLDHKNIMAGFTSCVRVASDSRSFPLLEKCLEHRHSDLAPRTALLGAVLLASFVALLGGPALIIKLLLGHLQSFDAFLADRFGEQGAHRKLLRTKSQLLEVRRIQEKLSLISGSFEGFSHMLPHQLIRDMIQGGPTDFLDSVTQREVTIMFSDIADFTTMSEDMAPHDLRDFLSRYFGVMTNIAEDHGGVVSEILGDGLLIFWNTPDDDPDHATNACLAAIAMQAAMDLINKERRCKKSISIRIGLHSGTVLSGLMGSRHKMKFGCLGDPVNLASRIEGLCKFWGCGVLCSEETYRQVQQDSSMPFRRLGDVRVKGRTKPTRVHEIMWDNSSSEQPIVPIKSHRSNPFANVPQPFVFSHSILGSMHTGQVPQAEDLMSDSSPAGAKIISPRSSAPSSARPPVATLDLARTAEAKAAAFVDAGAATSWLFELAQSYEEALQAYEQANFSAAQDLVLSLLTQWPQDQAAQRLLEATSSMLDAGLPDSERNKWTGVVEMTEK